MDNSKTGGLIKSLRKEKGITQKQLADALHITDRAVSKWERGLSAPDISLLEPLAQELECTVTELIRGERQTNVPQNDQTEQAVRNVLDYSRFEIRQKARRFRKRYLRAALCVSVLAAVVTGLLLWHSGVFFLISRSESPGGYTATLYSRDYHTFHPQERKAALLKIEDHKASSFSYMSFPAAENYQLWWSPDGEKLVLEAGELTELINLSTGTGSRLDILLTDAPRALEFSIADNQPVYRFLQWGSDSESMLIYYHYDAGMDGYFWYRYPTGAFEGLIEMNGRIAAA